MSKVYFISDLHFGHKNMALKRGFSSEEKHDLLIIENWNKVVTKRDVVYVLGDITFEKSGKYPLLKKLNGLIKVVLGNHDRASDIAELSKFVNSVCGAVKYKGFILTHIPIHRSEVNRFRGNIHGHTHEIVIDDKRYLNVSCEQVNFTPILFEKLIESYDRS